MNYNDMPVIIPVLATGYLLTIYLLLILAQRAKKTSECVANSFTDAYAPYGTTEAAPHTDEIERWSFRITAAAPLGLAKRGTVQPDAVASKELPTELSTAEVGGVANTNEFATSKGSVT